MAGRILNIGEAFAASQYAHDIINRCRDIEQLDEASDYDTAISDAPAHFSEAQKKLAQMIILDAYERSIGR